MKTIIFIINILALLSCGKSDQDILIEKRKEFINNNIKLDNNFSKSDSTFFSTFFDKGLTEHLYTKYNIPIKFCSSLNDTILAFSYTKNPVPVTDEYTDFTLKSNRKIKYMAQSIYNINTFQTGSGTILGDGILFNETKVRIYTQADLGYSDCIVCLFIITEDNCTHTGFSRVSVKR
jgi:hypothetical protein